MRNHTALILIGTLFLAAPFAVRAESGNASASQAEPAADAPISVAEKDGFTRIVLPWGSARHRLEQRNNGFVLRIERPIRPDTAVLNVERPKGVRAANGRTSKTRFGLHVALEPGWSARSFTEDDKIVIDLIAPRQSVSAPELARITPEQEYPAAPAPQPEPTRKAEKAAKPESKPRIARPAGGATVEPVPSAIHKPAPHNSDTKPLVKKKEVQEAWAPPSRTPEQEKPAEVRPEAKPEEPAANAAPKTPVPLASQAGPVLKVEETGSVTRLRLGFARPVAATVFVRGGRVWAVFDVPSKVDFSSVPLRDFQGIGTVEQLPDPRLTVLRIPLRPGFAVRAAPPVPGVAGPEWAIEVMPKAPPMPVLTVMPDPHADGGGRLRIVTPRAAGAFRLADPDSGDSLVVVPMALAGGLEAARQYVDCTLLASPQGLAVAPRTDGLQVSVADEVVTIARPGGLVLSDEVPTVAQDAAQPVAPSANMGAVWRAEPEAGFAAKRAALELAVAKAPEAERARHRLTLARFYAQNGLAAEALGILTLAARDDPNFAVTHDYHLARGQAELLMGRKAEAAASLALSDVASDPEALLWRGWALMLGGKGADAWQAFQASQMAALGLYPPQMQAEFRIAAARAAMAAGQGEAARRQLAALPQGLPVSVSAEAALVSGALAEQAKDNDRALASYDEAVRDGSEPVAAQARLRKIRLASNLGQTSKEATVEALEKLRFAWRGDDTERGATEALGELYLDDGHYREAFAAFDQAIRLFPNAPEAAVLNTRMRGVFTDLFLNGKADSLEPVKALGLFLEYRDLTPVGRDGDDMIRKLADRLAAVDLLDQAETLLDYQIKNRLDGVAKAQIAAKLAALALLNHDPQRALQAIRETRQTALPDALNEKRRIIEAQALMELGQNDDAMELIARFSSREAETLRAEIHWRAREWPQAAASLVGLLGTRTAPDLSASERQMVMKAAISYALAGDQNGLASLRGRYGTQMAKSADAASFDVLTGPIDLQGVKFRELASKIAGLDSLQGFLKSYKESL